MSSISRCSGLAFVAVAFAVALAPASASAAAPSCANLQGKDLVPGSLAKVVDRPSRTRAGRIAHRYYVCATRFSGRAPTLKASRRGGRLIFLDARGGMAAVRDVSTGRVFVYDLATLRRVRLLVARRNPSGRVLVTGAGEAAALTGTGANKRLTGFDFDGTAYELDRGAISATSLRRTGGARVTWRRGGMVRRADLSSPDIPCEKLGGRVETRTPMVRVTYFTYSGEFLIDELSGDVTRTRACLVGAAPSVRTLDESVVSTQGAQGGAQFGVTSIAGSYVLGLNSSTDSEGTVTQTLLLTELLGGRRSTVTGLLTEGRELLSTALTTDTGTVALIVQETIAGTDVGRVLARSPGGRLRELDRGPAEEFSDIDPRTDEVRLTLTGSVLSWMRAGITRTADLTAP